MKSAIMTGVLASFVSAFSFGEVLNSNVDFMLPETTKSFYGIRYSIAISKAKKEINASLEAQGCKKISLSNPTDINLNYFWLGGSLERSGKITGSASCSESLTLKGYMRHYSILPASDRNKVNIQITNAGHQIIFVKKEDL